MEMRGLKSPHGRELQLNKVFTLKGGESLGAGSLHDY
jgi:hypothetical protein